MTAPAAMPSEEEIARAILDAGFHIGTSTSPAEQRRDATEIAAAVFELFAPILAEKERQLKKLAEDWDAYGAKMAGQFFDEREKRLATEAALAKAIVFEVGEHHFVESRGDGTWAIKNGGCVLNVDGVWEWEPSPSDRTDEFIARTRFDRDDAFRLAAAIRAQGE